MNFNYTKKNYTINLLNKIRQLHGRACYYSRKTNEILTEERLTCQDGLPLESAPPGHGAILMYHGVVPDCESRFNWRHVSVSALETHLKMLQQSCCVLSVKDFIAGNFDPSRFNVAITFDDAFRNNLNYALPLLEKYKFPASIYATAANQFSSPWLWPDFLDIVSLFGDPVIEICGRKYSKKGKAYFDVETHQALSYIIKHEQPEYEFKESVYKSLHRWMPNMYRPDFRPYWELMNDEELKQIDGSDLITVGSHGYYHNNLGELSYSDAIDEIKRSKLYLESLLNRTVDELAYPDGSYTSQLIEGAGSLGFNVQLAVDLRYDESQAGIWPARRAGVYSFDRERTQLASAISSFTDSQL